MASSWKDEISIIYTVSYVPGLIERIGFPIFPANLVSKPSFISISFSRVAVDDFPFVPVIAITLPGCYSSGFKREIGRASCRERV